MARKRPGIVAVRRIVAGMCLFVGMFVACFGLGNGSQAILVAGIAIGVLAFSARVATSFRRNPRQWIRGTATVLEVSEPPIETRLGRCSLQLLLDVPGMPHETVIVHDSRVPVEQWPRPNQELPVQVAADDIRNVRVLWRDFIPVEMPLDAAWGDDVPSPAPATPPGSHLDPTPVIDFDLDFPPTGPLEPNEPLGPEPGDVIPEAEFSSTDEGRLSRRVPLAGPPGDASPAPAGPPGPQDPPGPDQYALAAQPSAPAAEAAEMAAAAQSSGTPERAGQLTATAELPPTPLPRPRPSPRPRRPVTGPTTPTASVPASATGGTPPSVSGGVPPQSSGGAQPSATGPGSTPGRGPISGVGMTVLVSELDRSVSFYRDRLGFDEVDRGEGTRVLASGGTRLVLRQARDIGAVKHRLVHLNLEVADIDAVYTDLKASGVRFTSAPRAVDHTARQELWAAAFRDPDGHGIALTQWRPAATGSA